MLPQEMSAFYCVQPPAQQPMIGYDDLMSPLGMFHRVFRKPRSVSGEPVSNNPAGGGNGAEMAKAAGLSIGVIAGLMLLAVVVNYQLGKAMAPDKASEPSWAWGNAIGGTLFPPATLLMAIYKNYIR